MGRETSDEGGGMIGNLRWRSAAACFVAASLTARCLAESGVRLELVDVGNPGNAADSTGFGAVPYAYAIGKYEVTAGQYAAFLNAVAGEDPHGLYNPAMADSGYGCRIRRSGESGSFRYGIHPEWADRPVNFVSFWDACRFANWLHNGRPERGQGVGSTEDGAYALHGATHPPNERVARQAAWRWAVASEDEWYKAAYHKPTPHADSAAAYWRFPTQTDEPPKSVLPLTSPGGATATYYGDGDTLGAPFWRTAGGAHRDAPSPYGAYDQAGNVAEWNDTLIPYWRTDPPPKSRGPSSGDFQPSSFRGMRGGSFYDCAEAQQSDTRESFLYVPTYEGYDAGFRLVCSAAVDSGRAVAAGETLPNGIRLPPNWPPRDRRPSLEPPPEPPYLLEPPEVIPIDVGRQLLVDDFLVQQTDLLRRYHAASYDARSPVLRPDRPWEMQGADRNGFPTAMTYSDGVWFDPADRLYKMWYLAGYGAGTCYAVSRDGLQWEKPSLDVVPGTNVVSPRKRGSALVWLDRDEQDPSRRYKIYVDDEISIGSLHYSPDGIHWGDAVARVPNCPSDRNTFFFNPFRNRWVYSVKTGFPGLGRSRAYIDCKDLISGAGWRREDLIPWAHADRLDGYDAAATTAPQLYNLDAVAYESLILGLFAVWRGQPADRPKTNELVLGYSRDGFHWTRPHRQPFLAVADQPGAWNWGNVQSAGGCCLVVGDRLRFYVSGRAGIVDGSSSGVCSTGLATLRRDGFVSMHADAAPGALTTRPVVFQGRCLFVNCDCPRGELRVEVLDQEGRPMAPFVRAECVPVAVDSTLHQVRWRQAEDLAAVKGKPVRFRFHLRQGDLYAFWVSADESGASQGYVAAGGPGFAGSRDTAGRAAYDAAR